MMLFPPVVSTRSFLAIFQTELDGRLNHGLVDRCSVAGREVD